MPPLYKKGSRDLLDTDIAFDLDRLFDKYNYDHVPENDRLDSFKKRDMAHVKHYKAAVRIFGGPQSRKRVIVAPPMETPLRHRIGEYADQFQPPTSSALNAELKPFQPPKETPTEEQLLEQIEDKKEKEYKNWIAERQKFRSDLNEMGLNEKWLAGKSGLSDLERRVLNKMKIENSPKAETPIVEEKVEVKVETPPVPELKMPPPAALGVLLDHLKEKRMRLIDLFQQVDKDKNWTLSREEFRKVIRQNDFPITDDLLDDLINALDIDLNDELDYKELVTGMDELKKKKLEEKREMIRDSTFSSDSTFSGPGRHTYARLVSRLSKTPDSNRESTDRKSREKSHGSIKTHDTNPSKESSGLDKTSHRSQKSRESTNISRITDSGSQSMRSQFTSGENTQRNNIRGQYSPEMPKTDRSGKESVTSKTTSIGSSKKRPLSNKSVTIPDNPVAMDHTPRKENTPVASQRGGSAKSRTSSGNSRSSTPQFLDLPSNDMRLEQLIQKTEEEMVDLRKHDRVVLSRSRERQGQTEKNRKLEMEEFPGVIKCNDPGVDSHAMSSTLGGEMGAKVDEFRRERLKEYHTIVELCQERDVPLTRKLLEKVFLYPADKPHSALKTKSKTSSVPPFSNTFANPPTRPRTPLEIKHKDKVKRSKSGQLMIDTRHRYPQKNAVAATGVRENLSTGRAVIRRKTDCWMTFDEYEKMTRHLAVRYQQMNKKNNENVFWPGAMLDKMYLCMPPYDKPVKRDGKTSVFKSTKQTKRTNHGYNNDLNTWPVGENGYVQYASYEPYSRKYIHAS